MELRDRPLDGFQFSLGTTGRRGNVSPMPYSPDAMRRWLGLLFLALAFGMLVWGQTVLRGKLERERIVFLIYWFICFIFVIAAIITALLDVRATRRRARREHEDLVRRTLEQIEDDKDGNK